MSMTATNYPLPSCTHHPPPTIPTTQTAAAKLRVLSDPSKEYVLNGAA